MASDLPDGAMLIADIHIVRFLDADGADIVASEAVDGNDEQLGLVEALGLLRMTEDTIIRRAMGETPEDEDAEDDA